MGSKEYIEREKIVDILFRHSQAASDPPIDKEDTVVLQTLHKILGEVKTAPAEDVEPVRYGFWEQGDCYDIGDVCSECQYDSCHEPCKHKYCPNCGAEMGGGKG